MKKAVLSLLLYSTAAYAIPEGFELISGQVSPLQINAQGQIHIQSTQDSVVHWNSFSLNPQEILIFDQAQATSSIVNRVVGSDPSEILGKLQSNGMVYLINPNGILIGPSGVIETAGFLASTLDVLTADFFTKNTLEFFSENPGSIVNLGKITCPIGQITLLVQSIANQGEINGSLQAIACTKATLQINNQRVFIQTNQELHTENLQSLSSAIQKNPYAHAIKHSGRITTNTLGMQEGRVYLFAQEGTTDITGYVEASDIQVLGKEVLLQEHAIIEASSDTQGGKVFIGGSYKGQDPQIPLAEHVLIDSKAQIHADAKQTGDGGEIIIWSEENTEFLGSLSAKGGTLSGNGGFAEVSGKRGLSFAGLVDLTAARGRTGKLLIDPDTINITPLGTDSVGGNVLLTAADSANSVLIGYGGRARVSNATGDILFNHVGGNLVLQGANSGSGNSGFVQIGHLSGGGRPNILNGNISLLVDGSISVIGGSSNASSYAQIGHGGPAVSTTTGQLTAIAGEDIFMQSNAGSASIINRGGDVILVTDNLFPTAPLIGPGFFSINSNLSASGQLRIYTAMRSQNQINDLINGALLYREPFL